MSEIPDLSEIKAQFKNSLAVVSGLDLDEINDSDSFAEALDLDSLAMAEVWVDVELKFRDYKLTISDEEAAKLLNIDQAVEKIGELLAKK